jgi:D-alanyl-D-alanine carboxypeptidase (penicillin-binding protein 5/6)
VNSYSSPSDRELDEIRLQIQQNRERRLARRRKQMRIRRIRILSVGLFFLLLIAGIIALALRDKESPAEETPIAEDLPVSAPVEEAPPPVYTVSQNTDTAQISAEFPSQYAVVIDAETGLVLAEKGSQTIISPASMTKILTLLVAVENITDWDQTFTMHIGITDYCFVNDCSVVGYELDEVIPVRELLYGCILSSGADACLALAEIVAGSHEGFVELMNAKLEDLGLSDTSHFTNCVGLYDENHYCTVEDMALMLKAALDNELCREVMSTKIYTTAPTTQHTEGQDLSNWFLRRIEDKDTGSIEVRYAKTGYVAQAGSCAASCGENAAGKRFLCVTANAYSSWRAIYDHVDLYNAYCQP